jgi:RNase P subunit RPR2
MLRKLLMSSAIAGLLAFGIPTGALAQRTTDAKQDAKKAGKEAKKAGQEAGEATKDAAKATAKGTRHAAKATVKKTKHVAKSIKHKLSPNTTRAMCKDGTTRTGRTKATACHDHGGAKG